MNLVAPLSECDTKFCCNNSATAENRVASDSNLHQSCLPTFVIESFVPPVSGGVLIRRRTVVRGLHRELHRGLHREPASQLRAAGVAQPIGSTSTGACVPGPRYGATIALSCDLVPTYDRALHKFFTLSPAASICTAGVLERNGSFGMDVGYLAVTLL